MVLRFNFRGVGASEGAHAGGSGEIEDARTALAYLRARYPELPYSLAGFSFGARVITKLGCSLDPPPERLIAVGFGTRRGSSDFLSTCTVPKYFIQSTIDEHGPKEELEAAFVHFAEPKQLKFIEADDHFFAGGLDELEAAIAAIRP